MTHTATARIERAFNLHTQAQAAIAELARDIEGANSEMTVITEHRVTAAIDVRKSPKMILIAEDGAEAEPGGEHVAVLLPQYGLMFSAEEPRKAKTHDEAVRFAGETQLLGFTDWRLPEVAELQLLGDRSKVSPAIDSEAFPHTTTNDWYWSSTIHASDPGYAWGVSIYSGNVGYLHRNDSGFVRAVRSVPPSQ